MTLSRHASLVGITFPLAAIITASLLLVSGCALNPFSATSPTASEAIPAADGVVQTVQKKKLFGVIPVYRPDVQQGNFVSKEMVAQLKVGMSAEQVRFVLGTPLVSDIFHGERWDYPFRMRDGGGQITTSHVSVFFKEGRVERFEGGDLPEEKDYLKRLAAPR